MICRDVWLRDGLGLQICIMVRRLRVEGASRGKLSRWSLGQKSGKWTIHCISAFVFEQSRSSVPLPRPPPGGGGIYFSNSELFYINREHNHGQREAGNALTQPPVQRPTLRSNSAGSTARSGPYMYFANSLAKASSPNPHRPVACSVPKLTRGDRLHFKFCLLCSRPDNTHRSANILRTCRRVQFFHSRGNLLHAESWVCRHDVDHCRQDVFIDCVLLELITGDRFDVCRGACGRFELALNTCDCETVLKSRNTAGLLVASLPVLLLACHRTVATSTQPRGTLQSLHLANLSLRTARRACDGRRLRCAARHLHGTDQWQPPSLFCSGLDGASLRVAR